ncbi:unnamed protein product [Echinostoma caproni]|uniref:Histone H2B n=1 Tax=Echinostoma caproni TaxID=27848 RepID=A0A183B6Q1_9TREM|nr:unnamed protein product [Echinostoma caproni]
MPPKVVSGKAAKKASNAKVMKVNKMKKRRGRESYATYTGIFSKVKSVMNTFGNDIFKQIALEFSHLGHYNKRSTIMNKQIETVVWLLLAGELAKYAIYKSTMAVTEYTSTK